MMTLSLPSIQALRRPLLAGIGVIALLVLALGLQSLWAQVSGDRGIAPVASSVDIMVDGIKVDVRGSSAEDARERGWRLAQREAWKKLGGPGMSDSQIERMVSAVVIGEEHLGDGRYIATLGVIFDRARAGGALGSGTGQRSYSAPMLTIPVLESGGAYTVYETRNAWQRVWAEFQAGTSAIDYVRPSGAGADSLLLNYGQVGRHSRAWWSNIIDQFGASDIIVPIARLERQWPGGPVKGYFTARHGPGNQYLGSFTLTANSEAELDDMLVQARDRFDTIFTAALQQGKLRPDPTLRLERQALDPTIAALIDAGRAVERAEEVAAQGQASTQVVEEDGSAVAAPQVVNSFTVQFATPNASDVDAALGSVRAVPGVRGAAATSIAIGGTSVMQVSFGGTLDTLAQGLRARGWRVTQGSNALSIAR